MRPLHPFILASLLLCNGCFLVREAARHLPKDESRNKPSPETLSYERPLPKVREGHPRLMIAQIPREDETLARWRQQLVARGDETLRLPPLEYSAKAMLARSREAMRRISLLAGLYQITHEQQWAEGARREILAVCNFRDWNPGDFLATAEMMNAVGIGYDWVYDTLSPEERRTIQTALIRKGLNPAIDAYNSAGGWTTAHHNWNLVCNGSVIVASLAILDDQPKVAERSLSYGLKSIGNGIGGFDEAGGTPEGPMYHNYAIKFLVYAAASLQTATGSFKPLTEQSSSWLKAGDYRIAMTGNSGKVANFGDGADQVGNPVWMLWLGGQTHRPDYAAFDIDTDMNAPSIFDYLWYVRPNGQPPATPLVQKFGAAVTLRNPPGGRHDAFVAIRYGSNVGNHSHLDLGTFVLDLDGQRWASDLGADNYDLPGYLNERRADYLRSSTPGHNTLSIGNASQPGDGVAEAISGGERGDKSSVTIDLTNAYPHGDKILRTAGVSAAGNVSVVDSIRLDTRGAVTWNLHTSAKATPTKDGWILENNGKHVRLSCKAPEGSRFSAQPDATHPPALPIEGMTHLRITTPPAERMEITVTLAPQ